MGRLGGLIGSAAPAVVIWWFLFTGLRNASNWSDFLWLMAGLLRGSA